MQENNETILTLETEILICQVLVLFDYRHFLPPNFSERQLIVTRDYPAFCGAAVANFAIVGNTAGV